MRAGLPERASQPPFQISPIGARFPADMLWSDAVVPHRLLGALVARNLSRHGKGFDIHRRRSTVPRQSAPRNTKGICMKEKFNALFIQLRRLVKDSEGQDLVEYALLAGFVAVAAGALLPGISDSISIIFSKMASVLSAAAV